jgi:hypothetical protein
LLLWGAEKVPISVRCFPIEGIEAPRPDSPPNRWIPRQKLSSSTTEFVIAGPPPAKLTSPAGSRWAFGPPGPFPLPLPAP